MPFPDAAQVPKAMLTEASTKDSADALELAMRISLSAF